MQLVARFIQIDAVEKFTQKIEMFEDTPEKAAQFRGVLKGKIRFDPLPIFLCCNQSGEIALDNLGCKLYVHKKLKIIISCEFVYNLSDFPQSAYFFPLLILQGLPLYFFQNAYQKTPPPFQKKCGHFLWSVLTTKQAFSSKQERTGSGFKKKSDIASRKRSIERVLRKEAI
jgi:hypothetical protein